MEGVPTGLLYGSLPATASMMGFEMTPDLFDDMRDMEAAALKVWREKAEIERQNRERQ